ncbi:Acb2/Tad1 domain-containing protein [Rhodococcus zopfii]|uniref:Acb2/Tad1 domain-containing protein n=1 Tax=Rhodococcus zopfii TaxID=43772 RepID=UPI000ADF024E|nr:hypothetical protein [Rhodococcus zopfii]
MTDHSSPTSAADINNRFDFHPATTAEKRGEHTSIREACKTLAHTLDARVPGGREKALALTHLEEVMFWSNAAIARAGDPAAPDTPDAAPARRGRATRKDTSA